MDLQPNHEAPLGDPYDILENHPRSSENPSSVETSRPGSAGGIRPKGKKIVGFTNAGSYVDTKDRPRSVDFSTFERHLSPKGPGSSPANVSPHESGATTPTHSRQPSTDVPSSLNRDHLPTVSQAVTDELRAALTLHEPLRPRPALRRGDSALSAIAKVEDDGTKQNFEAREAYERAKRLENKERIRSAPTSRRSSPTRDRFSRFIKPRLAVEGIQLQDFDRDSDSDVEHEKLLFSKSEAEAQHVEAANLVRAHTKAANKGLHINTDGSRSGITTPIYEQYAIQDYVPKPEQYRGGVLGALLKLYNHSNTHSPESHQLSPAGPRAHVRAESFNSYSALSTPQHSPPMSGTTTPGTTTPGTTTPLSGGKSRKHHWYSPKHGNQSSSSLAHLVGSSSMAASPAASGLGEELADRLRQHQKAMARPKLPKRTSSGGLSKILRPHLEDEIRITIHIAETIARQKYLLKLCRALMQYGAPTHRLEEYMRMSARVLEIDAQFLYIPGCMIMSFDDISTHTTEVKLVRVAQGLDLGKLRDAHEVYKEVVHDRIGVEEATQRLHEVNVKPLKHTPWALVPVYGIASAAVGPFAFGARFIDLPMAFVLGCILGFLQLIVAPQSELYANVFEISAAVITSFLARALGSLRGGQLFCFSALAQSSIALILPGYTVLCASLELQSRSIVAGSVRMVYAIIYSLFLGFGITIGTAIYGIMDKNATSATTCTNPMGHHYYFIAVPVFTMCLIVINQAKWKQAPVMMVIAFAGYVVNYFSSKRFAGNTQVSNALGALAIGVMANLYSRLGQTFWNYCLDVWEDRLRPLLRPLLRFLRKRFAPAAAAQTAPASKQARMNAEAAAAASSTTPSRASSVTLGAESTFVTHTRKVGYGLAAAAMLPAIFVQVPSGLAISGSLVSGIASANQITGNATNGTTVVNATTLAEGTGVNSVAFNVGYSVIQVAIGITVGLFLSAIIVYPFGKKRSGLFSF